MPKIFWTDGTRILTIPRHDPVNARAEARYDGVFFRLARHYFDLNQIRERADYFFDYEAELIQSLPPRAAVH